MTRVAVLGGGAWGTAIASALASRLSVILWVRDPGLAESTRRDRVNERYLPGRRLADRLAVEAALERALADATLVLAATPVAGLRALLKQLAEHGSGAPLLWLCKGIERGTGLLPHEIVAQAFEGRRQVGVLSGPSFADEVVRGLPCALTLASRDGAFARDTAARLHGDRLRVYSSNDLVGVEMGGAYKNVLAIAVGICDGLGLGQNARAALITRGLAEMTRLGTALGGEAATFMGLAGVGDLILTAIGDLSRNRRVGLALALDRPLEEILRDLGHVAEGVHTAAEILRRAAQHRVDVPIAAAVVAVLEGRMGAPEAAQMLMSRDPRPES